jgi:hypothetical protein
MTDGVSAEPPRGEIIVPPGERPGTFDRDAVCRALREETIRLRRDLIPLGLSSDEWSVPIDRLAAAARLRRLTLALRRLEYSSRRR